MNEENEILILEGELRQASEEAYAAAVAEEAEEELTPEDRLIDLKYELRDMAGGILKIEDARESREAAEQVSQGLKLEELEALAEKDAKRITEEADRAEAAEVRAVQREAGASAGQTLAGAESLEMAEAAMSFQTYAAAAAELQAIEEENQELMNAVTVLLPGEKTWMLSEARYNELLATERDNKNCRYIGVEQFRLWAQGLHPEVVTVQDALRACSVEEMKRWITFLAPVRYGSNAVQTGMSIFMELAARLTHRAELRAEAQERINGMEVVMPDV